MVIFGKSVLLALLSDVFYKINLYFLKIYLKVMNIYFCYFFIIMHLLYILKENENYDANYLKFAIKI